MLTGMSEDQKPILSYEENGKIGFQTVKRGKRRNSHSSFVDSIKTKNRFEALMEETLEQVEEHYDDNEKFETEVSKSEVSKLKSKKMERRVKKQKTERVETFNKLALLVDNSEEDLSKRIVNFEIDKTPKHQLKKCRKCNYKKRTCTLNSLSCKACQNVCSFCLKHGHFPQSIDCKKRKKMKQKVLSDNTFYDDPNGEDSGPMVQNENNEEMNEKDLLCEEDETELQTMGENNVLHCCIPQLDGGDLSISEENDNELQINCKNTISLFSLPQLDGGNDRVLEEKVPTCLFAVQCENANVVCWINFFRGLDFSRIQSQEHNLCSFNKNIETSCSLVRSTCARLSNRGKRGPRKIKPYEAVSQLGKYMCNWEEEDVNMIKFIEETFNHMQRNNVYLPLKIKCAECGIFNDLFGDRVTDVDTEKLTNLGSLNVGDIFQKMVSEEQTNYCIHGLSSQMICTDSKIVSPCYRD